MRHILQSAVDARLSNGAMWGSMEMESTRQRFDLTPKPTEYKGVVFRSKSEAIFARALESRGIIWEYEPTAWKDDDGWCPDFLVVWYRRNKILSALIEYKPSTVTDTYFEVWKSRIEWLGKHFGMHNILPLLACGNAYAPLRQTFDIYPGRDIEPQLQLFKFIEEAARHRFDLIHQ